ncbi:hypothetical protein T440DRAFT_459260 [Plenodomus tracheiphilus IPT5]|uniref:Xylanolytic transcriptional activator regulatory domain-containing protein n=1 Tax=Plenodomus tracheiphilus IPT5 TaxID=1408161 RepID=A0A6A7AVB6_9PLEO|nr:hypothetical protein T440DRAFT_459260 [Plenodomus tracheiphilus IPT5]
MLIRLTSRNTTILYIRAQTYALPPFLTPDSPAFCIFTMDNNQLPTSLRFCSLCDKPFTGESSYNRHVSYCRRSQARPRHRQKSCRPCSLARTKCSFHSRCTRCVAKELDCVYDRPPVAHKTNSPTLDVAPPFPTWPLSPTSDGFAPPDTFGFENDASIADLTDLLTIPGHPRTTPDFFPAPGNIISAGNTLPAPTDTGFLTRLPMSNPVAQHSATLVMQALRAFPQMMLRKLTFPPFIHSYCHWHPLPEPLAHCMSIAHIFVSPSIETRSFLWQSIKREQQRFLDEMTKMSKEDVLAAVQAQLIYIIMRVVVDDAQKSAECNMQMLVAFQILSERFMKLCEEPFCLPETWAPGSTWHDWVFAESRRRTACVWFLISRIVCVKTGIPCDATESFRTLPLACPKTLWEASTIEIWASEYDVYGATTPGAGLDSFGSLIESNKRCKEPAHARRLDVWIAQVDKLGSLLNAAVSMV